MLNENPITRTLTKQFQINDRVKIKDINNAGEVIGYASTFPIFYIIRLDKPLTMPGFENWTGVSLEISMLEKE